jgi:peroxiredoxin Q/BCP
MEDGATPEVGARAPEFTLQGTGGKTVALRDFLGRKNLVLYFYPKDDTPGCTVEAKGFRDVSNEFEALDTVILGVSRDGLDAHRKFSDKCRLSFLLLSDPDGVVARAYGVFGKKSFMGREFLGIHRTTFVIDRKGIVRRVWPRVKVKEHAAEVLDFVKSAFA